MAHYLLAVYHELAADFDVAELDQFTDLLKDRGEYIYSGGLQEPAAAVTVHPSGVLGDGPVAPQSPQLHCFWVIDAATRTEAQALAVRAAGACGQRVELRPMNGA